MNQYEKDKLSINQMTKTFFSLFTNKNGTKPNVVGIYTLFIPEGILIKNVGTTPEIYNLKAFIEPRVKLLNSGELVDFFEEEISERTDIFGNIAQRFCSYRKSGVMAGERFESKGMKTIQFIRTLNGWKMCSVAWDDERDGLEIPSDYHEKS